MNNDLSSSLELGTLAPASSIQSVESQTPDQDDGRKRRRDARPEPQESGSDETVIEAVENRHQFDDLA